MIRHIDISFYGDLLKSGKSYIVWGTIRLTAHDSYTEHPKVNTIFQINNWSRMLMSRSQTRYQRSGLSLTLLMIYLFTGSVFMEPLISMISQLLIMMTPIAKHMSSRYQ